MGLRLEGPKLEKFAGEIGETESPANLLSALEAMEAFLKGFDKAIIVWSLQKQL